MGGFQSTKVWLGEVIGLSKDALHVYVGLGVFLLTALLFRLPLRDWRPLAAALLVAVAGETWDMIEWTARGHAPRWGSAWHDLWNTMFWPLALFALARWTGVLKR